jgi:hypothetical protein
MLLSGDSMHPMGKHSVRRPAFEPTTREVRHARRGLYTGDPVQGSHPDSKDNRATPNDSPATGFAEHATEKVFGKKAQLAIDIGRAVIDGGLRHRTFGNVERFCLFVGFPRSGTTLVGTLLNAHPHIVIAQELDVLRYVRLGLRRDQIYSMILRRDREFAAAGFRWTGYDYTVPGQYQGRYQRLQVIGDKRAGMTTNRLRERPELIDRVRRTVGVPLRVIHVVRSPFDTAATMARRRQCDLSFAIDHYARLAVTVDQVRSALDPEELIDLRYEELTADPQGQLRRLCEFVGVSADASYLGDCGVQVRAGGSRSREATQWSDADREAVEDLIAGRPVLAGYTMTT